MASGLSWFYDILIIGILLICLYLGAKRGLMRSVALAVLICVSIAFSWLCCTVASPVIYEKCLKTPIINALKDASSKTDPLNIVSSAVSSGGYGVEMTNSEVQGVISQSGDFFANIAGEIKNNGASESEETIGTGMEESVTESMLKALVGDVVSPSTLTEILSSVRGAENNMSSAVGVFLKGDRDKTAEAMEETVVAPAVKLVLKALIWVIMMFILMLISRIVADMFKGLNKIPVIGPVNSTLGALLGAAEGTVIVYVIAQLVRLICYLTSNSLMFLNTETVQNTHIFKYLFYFDIMTIIG